jgi:hypothetical protein
MKQGWIKLHRSLKDSDLWLDGIFTRGQAWVDILMNTNHKSGYFRTANGRRVDIARGQCGMSQLTMAERWQWSRGKVKRFLNELEKDGNVVQQTVQQNSVLTVCNYSKYQDKDAEDDTIHGAVNGQQTVQQTDSKRYTNKNDKKEKKEKNDKKYKYTDADLRSAQVMFEKLQSRHPHLKQPNYESWANDLRLMREIDERKPDDIAAVFNFAIDDDFWSNNILSASKLRKQFDALFVKMNSGGCGKEQSRMQRSIQASKDFLESSP